MDAASFFTGVENGSVALKDAGQLSGADVDAIARVGAAALQGGRFAQAVQVFTALTALEPNEKVHALHLALALHGGGDVAGAVAALGRVVDAAHDDEDSARALLLRAELTGRSDAAAARGDLARARALTAPAAKKLVDAALGAAPTVAAAKGVR